MVDDELRTLAKVWRGRSPSGRYILHRIPRDWWCPKHGPVTKWHECDWHLDKKDRSKIERLGGRNER